jgi:3-deoxy-manno-octulosonate cytidylyltransferase (CMP-KDO synthetase)
VADDAYDVASLYWPVHSTAEAKNPNAVKVVVDSEGRALYFSRAMIPFPRSANGSTEDHSASATWKRHIGLYAYRAGALRLFTSMQPTLLETAEKLEQLRFLEAGRQIRMAQACEPIPAGVDTPDDLERVRKHFLG